MENIIRIIAGPPLPHQSTRTETLHSMFGDVAIHNISPTYNLAEFFLVLQKKAFALSPVAIEVDTRERHIIGFLAGGAAHCLVAPFLLPMFKKDGDFYPQFDLRRNCVVSPHDAIFVGYAHLVGATPVPEFWYEV